MAIGNPIIFWGLSAPMRTSLDVASGLFWPNN